MALNVVCLKWGTKYSVDYVNRLYRMVARQCRQPFVFYCMTDDAAGFLPEIHPLPLPALGLHGWWYKLYLFRQDFYGLQGRVLFLDLDVVITGSLDVIVDHAPAQFCISPDRLTGDYNSSVMTFTLGTMGYVWDSFWAQREKVIGMLHGDQDWIQRVVVDAVILPRQRVVSFKYDCEARPRFSGGSLGQWMRDRGVWPARAAVLPEGASIVLFHGKPDPEDVMNGPYQKYRAAPWVREHWR